MIYSFIYLLINIVLWVLQSSDACSMCLLPTSKYYDFQITLTFRWPWSSDNLDLEMTLTFKWPSFMTFFNNQWLISRKQEDIIFIADFQTSSGEKSVHNVLHSTALVNYKHSYKAWYLIIIFFTSIIIQQIIILSDTNKYRLPLILSAVYKSFQLMLISCDRILCVVFLFDTFPVLRMVDRKSRDFLCRSHDLVRL